MVTADNVSHRCETPVRPGAPCAVGELGLGEARLVINNDRLGRYQDDFDVEDDDAETRVYNLSRWPSLWSMLLWTYGGMFSVAGVALIGVGAGQSDARFVYGGIPALLAGGAMIWLGFLPEGMIWVSEDSYDLASRGGAGGWSLTLLPSANGVAVVGTWR